MFNNIKFDGARNRASLQHDDILYVIDWNTGNTVMVHGDALTLLLIKTSIL